LVFGPLAFGAVEPWAMFVLQAGSVVAFLLWIASKVVSNSPTIEFQLVHIPPIVFAGIVLWQIFGSHSAYRHQTVTDFLNYIAYGLLFIIATDLFRNEREVRALCLAFAVLGFSLAVIGSLQEFTADGKLYWIRTPRDTGAMFGPYVNRSHYAGVIELLFPFALLGSLKLDLEIGKRLILGFAAVLMVATVFLSGSRGGALSIVFQVIFLCVLLLMRSRRPALAISLSLVLLCAAAFGTWLGSDRLLGRIGELKNGSQIGRLQMAEDGLRMFKQHPLVGWGLGTFPVVYPKYRTFATDLYVNEAHNDFVQMMVEVGIFGFLAGIALLLIVFRNGIVQIERGNFTSWRTLAVAASMISVVGIAVHSLFDFNLQIPANALIFYVLCGVAGTSLDADAEVAQIVGRGNHHSLLEPEEVG
jgi:O-antigen ligase